MLVSEYINQRDTPQLSGPYVEYLKQRGYQLITVKDYGNILKRLVNAASLASMISQKFCHDCIGFHCINIG